MIRFDKLKICSHISNISDINTEKFVSVCKDDKLIRYRYKQEHPFFLLLMVDNVHKELVIEFTSKILLDDCPKLITSDTIRHCLEQINRMGICHIDVDNIITQSYVVKCDVTVDIVVEMDIKSLAAHIKQNITNSQKWVVKKHSGGVVVENVCTTPRHKKRLTIYDKSKELQKADNRDFLSTITNKEQVLSYFANKVRFELNLNAMDSIRKLLNIADNDLMTVLNADANPILTVVDEAVNDAPMQQPPKTLRNYERGLLLKECNYDLAEVEAKVRALSSQHTSITRQMEPYKALLQASQASTDRPITLRSFLAV